MNVPTLFRAETTHCFAIIALLGMTALLPGSAAAGLVITNSGSLVAPPTIFPINPSNTDTLSTPFTNGGVNLTGGLPAEFDTTGEFGSLNGYTDAQTALTLSHQGQFVLPTDGQMSYFALSTPTGFGVSGIDFQLDYSGTHTGNVTVTGFDASGAALGTFSTALSNGQDSFVLTATGGSQITSFLVHTTGADPANYSIADVKNLSFQGLAAIPEPTSMALMGLGVGGFVIRRWRRRKVDEPQIG